MREEVRLLHILDRRLAGQVDRLAHGAIRAVLERGLHPDVPLGRDVERDREDALPLLRDPADPAGAAAVLEDPVHEVRRPEAFPLRDILEVREGIRKLLPLHHALEPDQGELGLAAAGRVRDHRQRARRRDRRYVRVPDLDALLPVAGADPRGVRAPDLRELVALVVADVLDELHHPPAPLDALFGVVRHLEHEQHPGEAHHAESDLACRHRHLLDLLHGVRVHVDHVVEEVRRGPHGPLELLPVDVPAAARAAGHVPF